MLYPECPDHVEFDGAHRGPCQVKRKGYNVEVVADQDDVGGTDRDVRAAPDGHA